MVALKRGVDADGSTLAGQARKFVWVGSLSQLQGGRGTGLDSYTQRARMTLHLSGHAVSQ